MPFQNGQFVRNQNFTRDRDLGAPNDTIDAAKVDNEMDNLAGGLTTVSLDVAGVKDTLGLAYSRDQLDEKLATKFDKAGGAIAGPVTLGGRAGAAKGVVASGTTVFDFVDGSVQSITVNGPVTFDFANLPASGGSLQINLTIQSGSITVAGTTWWELGGGEKSTTFSDVGLALRTGRPYRLIVEMVAGFRTGIFQ